MIALSRPSAILSRFGKLALAGLLPLVLVGIIGAYVTHQVAGQAGLAAMLVGCAVGVLGNWIGTVPVSMVNDLSDKTGTQAVLLGMGLRFGAVLVLAPVLALSGWVEATPFVLWVALSYLTVLFGETTALVVMTRSRGESDT